MFKREYHRLIAGVLASMNVAFLKATCCYFGGGTAIALQLDEFRESMDIDFLCSDATGYRLLRESVFAHGIADLFSGPCEVMREVRADQYGIRTFLFSEGKPIKFEIIREDRITLCGADVPAIPVPCLSKTDLFAEKLLANADRFGDKSVMSRDMIDLLVMEDHWGKIPPEVWDKVGQAYGDSARGAYLKAKAMLREEPAYFKACLETLAVSPAVAQKLEGLLA